MMNHKTQFEDLLSEQMSNSFESAYPKAEVNHLSVDKNPKKTLEPLVDFVGDEINIVGKLSEHFPDATQQELLRFCRARGGSLEAASKMYKDYLEWRQGQGAPANLLRAYEAMDSKYVRHTGFAKDGSPLILVQGARYDPEVGAETTALGCFHLVDSVLSAADSQKFTVLIDVRPHEGWANVPAAQMMPLFRLAGRVGSDNFPERCGKVIVYPMPAIVRGLWAVVSRLFDEDTRNKFVILGGSCDKGAPCPAELGDYVTLDQLPADSRDMFAQLC
jgi:hypothetical protein